jgi:hypothetical protein
MSVTTLLFGSENWIKKNRSVSKIKAVEINILTLQPVFKLPPTTHCDGI